MDLFVVRHAIAEVRIADRDDPDRALTRDGKRTFKKVVRGLRALGWRFEHVLTSPWTRAAQTADLLRGRTTVPTDLLCQSPRAELFAMIAEAGGHAVKKNRATAVVGHAPWLGELVGLLAFGDGRTGEAIAFKKGGVVWLEGTAAPGGMTVRAVLPPPVLAAIDPVSAVAACPWRGADR